MFNIEDDRVDYGNLLVAPEGYEFDFALCTTYSLNLDALLGTCISLGFKEETDNFDINDKMQLVNILQDTKDKLIIFCENGQIQTVKRVSPFYSALDTVIFPIAINDNRANETTYPSFHPKLWILRYINKDEILYRVIVLSRNLSFDRSLDFSIAIDGKVTKEENRNNNELVKYIRHFKDLLPKTNKKNEKLLTLIDELKKVDFQLDKEYFTDYKFLPNSIKSEQFIKESDLFTRNFEKLLIMSPFISDKTIIDFNSRFIGNIEKNKPILITRRSEIGETNFKLFDKFRIFVIDSGFVDGESPETVDFENQDIHAKFYLTSENGKYQLYMGSANASTKAINENEEILLSLGLKNGIDWFQKFTEEILKLENEKESLFIELTEEMVQNQEREKKDNTDIIIKDISRLKFNTELTQKDSEGLKWDVSISFSEDETLFHNFISNCKEDIYIYPVSLQADMKKIFSSHVIFENLRIEQLSEFYVIETGKISRIIKIPTDIPPDRDSYVNTAVLENTANLMNYISLMIGDDLILSMLEKKNLNQLNSQLNQQILYTSIYEKLLKQVISEEGRIKIKKIYDFVIDIKDKSLVPPGLKELLEKFVNM